MQTISLRRRHTLSTTWGALGIRPSRGFTTPTLANLLLRFLRRKLGAGNLHFVEAPKVIPCASSWETTAYRFQLAGTSRLSPAYRQPLVLRLFPNARGLPHARHEFAVQGFLQRHGYRVPAPLLLGDNCDLLGGPFLIMEFVPGKTPFDTLLRRPWSLLSQVQAMAAAHVQLHDVPAKKFPGPRGRLLPRSLKVCQSLIEQHELHGLEVGLRWLEKHRPPQPKVPCVLHLDYHPLNLVGPENGPLVVLDWNHADRGDPHADVATSLMLIACVPTGTSSVWNGMVSAVGRPMLGTLYRQAYARLRPLDRSKLAYYQAWAALNRLCRYGRWLRVGAEQDGFKQALTAHLTPTAVATLCHYFRRFSGVAAELEV
jgi:aminoglycoside phosphotransferase (APT) family kinase protein